MRGVIVAAVLVLVVVAFLVGFYLVYRRGLRYAKGIERGIKMVPILISLPPASEDIEVGGRDVRDVIQERISQAEVLYNLIASTATKGFKSKFFGQRHIGFEIVAINGVIRFYAAVPVAMVPVIKQAILTAYPGARLDEVEDHNIFSQAGKITGTYGGEVKLKKDYTYPIATFNQLKRDAVQGIINALTSLEAGDGAGIQILLRPAREGWSKGSESLAKKLREGKGSGLSAKHILQAPFKVPEGGDDKEGPKQPKQLSNLEQGTIEAIEDKTKSAGYEVLIRVISSSGTAARAQTITRNIVSSFSLFDAPGLNGFKFEPAKNMEQFVTDFIFRFFPPERRKMILNSVELSTLFHFPEYQFTQTTQVERQFSKQVEGPSKLSQQGLVIGENVYRNVKKQIRLSEDDRRRHVYIVGQTGTGKSVLLENLMIQDMHDGKGFAFIDPHGDSAEDLLGMVPKDRTEDVIYFDPGNMENPLGLNIFEYKTEDQKDFLIQETINMLYRLYDPQHQGIIGPRYEHLFRNAALTVMADPAGGTFVDIPKLFRDPQFVREKLKHVEDKTVLEFWQKEMPQSQRSNDFGEIVSWFVSKFGAFLSNQMMRNIIGQPKSSFDLREIMDSNKILIANLSKGRLGELNSQLLGMIFVMKFQAAAMSRANVPESQRRDFSLYVDEFQNFSTESFSFILSEARKYRMSLIVANQFIGQLSEEIRDAVFGNVGTIVSFRTGPEDADFLSKQFSPVFNDRDLVNLPNYNAAIRLMSAGLPTQPFNLVTLPPFGKANPRLAEALKQLSAAKYGRPRKKVEEDIFNRLSTKPAPSPFDSLATSRAGTQTPGAPAAPGGPRPASKPPSDSSFLDEWLAKRRQSLQSQGQTPSAGRPQPPGTPTTPPSSTRLQDTLSSSGAGTTSPQPPPPPPPPPPRPAPATDSSAGFTRPDPSQASSNLKSSRSYITSAPQNHENDGTSEAKSQPSPSDPSLMPPEPKIDSGHRQQSDSSAPREPSHETSGHSVGHAKSIEPIPSQKTDLKDKLEAALSQGFSEETGNTDRSEPSPSGIAATAPEPKPSVADDKDKETESVPAAEAETATFEPKAPQEKATKEADTTVTPEAPEAKDGSLAAPDAQAKDEDQQTGSDKPETKSNKDQHEESDDTPEPGDQVSPEAEKKATATPADQDAPDESGVDQEDSKPKQPGAKPKKEPEPLSRPSDDKPDEKPDDDDEVAAAASAKAEPEAPSADSSSLVMPTASKEKDKPKDSQPRKLKPGEIYIDEEGNIHQG